MGLNTTTDALNALEGVRDNNTPFFCRAKQHAVVVANTLAGAAGVFAESILLQQATLGCTVNLTVDVPVALLRRMNLR